LITAPVPMFAWHQLEPGCGALQKCKVPKELPVTASWDNTSVPSSSHSHKYDHNKIY